MIQNVSVIGLGKLGASMLAGMASRGFDVIGVDIAESCIRAVNEGRAPVQETGLDKLIFEYRDKIRATTNHEEAVLGTDISFVIVPTPSDSRGAFELQYAKYAFEQLGKALAKKDGYHVIVLTSTVLPGATRHGLLPVLEAASGKKCGKDFGLCYSPEFIALGSVIRDFLNPDFYLVGEFDHRSGDALEEMNRKICVKRPVVHRMSIENAEIAKIALNSYVTMKSPSPIPWPISASGFPAVMWMSSATPSARTRASDASISPAVSASQALVSPGTMSPLASFANMSAQTAISLSPTMATTSPWPPASPRRSRRCSSSDRPRRYWACHTSRSRTSSRNPRASHWRLPWRRRACE